MMDFMALPLIAGAARALTRGATAKSSLQKNRALARRARSGSKDLSSHAESAPEEEEESSQPPVQPPAAHGLPGGQQGMQKMTAGLMRASFFWSNLFFCALEVATFGLAAFFVFFPHAVALGRLNLEMIVGKWICKGKNPIIPAISWDPIPLSMIDKNANFMQIIIIMSDLIFVASLVMPFVLLAMLISALTS